MEASPAFGQHIAARQFRRFDVGQVERRALPGQRALGRLAVTSRRARAAAGRRVQFDLLLLATAPEISVPVTTCRSPSR
jgi:hypothetical protein